MIKAIIFDLDGVIVDTDRFHYLAWKNLADSLGIYFDEKINSRCRGVSRLESLNIVLENTKIEYSLEEKNELANRKNKIYRKHLETMTSADVSDDVKKTLKELKKKGLKIAIGSSSKNARFILERVGLINSFDVIVDGTEVIHSKPHPEVFLKAAEKLILAPKHCAVVEDSVAGIQAGISAGMITYAIGDATNCLLADYNIESIKELIMLIG